MRAKSNLFFGRQIMSGTGCGALASCLLPWWRAVMQHFPAKELSVICAYEMWSWVDSTVEVFFWKCRLAITDYISFYQCLTEVVLVGWDSEIWGHLRVTLDASVWVRLTAQCPQLCQLAGFFFAFRRWWTYLEITECVLMKLFDDFYSCKEHVKLQD